MTHPETGAGELADLFDSPLPESIAGLPEAERRQLADLVRAACEDRKAALEAAAFGALDGIPVFLRGAVRKAAGI